jgi:hypothetical protein
MMTLSNKSISRDLQMAEAIGGMAPAICTWLDHFANASPLARTPSSPAGTGDVVGPGHEGFAAFA